MKTSLIALSALAVTLAAPAEARRVTHKHFCNCGHSGGSKTCGSSSSTSTGGTTTSSGGTTTSSGGTTTTSGGTTTTSGGTTTTSGGTTTTSSGGSSTSSGGTAVPEPGVMGLMGLSLMALGVARRRQKRLAA
ncbi:PEP-CTERM sorting domain-containing protein [Novosphingobium piscinae]|nr:PEP-CTERM sorting domain-containing protein [Novosphingobium piscinae]